MNRIRVETSQIIDARPEAIYALLSDYRVAHPSIVPRPPFTEIVVEKGGQGAGTVQRVGLKAFGRTFSYHQVVSEPEPGRVILETDMDSDQFTSFMIDPVNGGQQTQLTIHSEFPRPPGIEGVLMALMQPYFTRQIYKKEMQLIADYVRKNRAG